MAFTQNKLGSDPKTIERKKSEKDYKPFITARTVKQDLDSSQFEGQDFCVLGSQPGGFRGSKHDAEDEFYLEGTLRMIQANVRPGKVRVIIASSITANDFLTKYPAESSSIVYAFLNGCNLFLMSPPAEGEALKQSDYTCLYLYRENDKYFYEIDNITYYLENEDIPQQLKTIHFNNKKCIDDDIRFAILNTTTKQGHKTLPKTPITELEKLKDEKNPEKQLAKLFTDFSRPLTIKKEEALCAKHKTHLEEAAKRKNEYKLTIDYEILGWQDFLKEFKQLYEKEKQIVQYFFDNNIEKFRDKLYKGAVDFLTSKGLKVEKKDGVPTYTIVRNSQLEKLINKNLEPNFKFLGKIDWIKFLIESSVLYLLEEAPFFLAVKGVILYPSPVIEEIFQTLLKKNQELTYIQIKFEPQNTKRPSAWIGRSSSFYIHQQTNSDKKEGTQSEKKWNVPALKPSEEKINSREVVASSSSTLITSELPASSNPNSFIEGIRSQPLQQQISVMHKLLGEWLKTFNNSTEENTHGAPALSRRLE